MKDAEIEQVSNNYNKSLDYDLTKIRNRYMVDHNVDEEKAVLMEDEFRKWMALCAARPEAEYLLTGPVDHYWHTFLMYTRDYRDFCDKTYGTFIEHVPAEPDGQEKPTKKVSPEGGHVITFPPGTLEGYDRFITDYSVVFGEPPVVWPKVSGIGSVQVSDGGACGRGTSCTVTSCGTRGPGGG